MQLLGLILRRFLHGLLLVLAVIVLNFLLIHIAPGDPADTIAGAMGGATKEVLAQIRATYGLNRPLSVQLWVYLMHVLHGDLGHSYYFNAPVLSLILERLPATLLLVITSLIASLGLGTLLGVVAARRPNGILSGSVTVLSLVGYAAPVFWTGLMLVLVFASWLPIFPVSGMHDVSAQFGFWGNIGDVARHLVLPAVTLTIIYLAVYSRLSRASMMEALQADYVRTARAKGLGEGRVVYKHALRNAVLPVITVAGLQSGQLIAGAVLVETVFNWPGMGRLAFDSILRRDYPTILGILLFSAIMVIVANILTDLAYRVVDPRLKAGRG